MLELTAMVVLIVFLVLCLAIPLVGLMWMFWHMFFGSNKSWN